MKNRIIQVISLLLFLTCVMCFGITGESTQEEQNQPFTVIRSEPPVEEIEVIESEPEQENKYELISLGDFKLTAYCSCKECCGEWAENRGYKVLGASNQELISGYSIAVDPKLIPYNTLVVINGELYEAMDCGGSIKRNRIDIYFSDHKEALNFGVQYAEVFILREVNYED